MKSSTVWIVLASLLLLTSCGSKPLVVETGSLSVTSISGSESDTTLTGTVAISTKETPAQTGATSVGIANPASKNCTDNGGTLKIQKQPNGGEYGVCYFEDNRQCEEWALMRGECPKGGRKITGYDNDAQVFCAITGGQVQMDTKPVLCRLPGGLGDCSVDDYFNKGKSCATK